MEPFIEFKGRFMVGSFIEYSLVVSFLRNLVRVSSLICNFGL